MCEMFLKNDLSNNKIWSNYAKPKDNNCNDWRAFCAHRKPERAHQKLSQNCVPVKIEQSRLPIDSNARFEQRLKSLPDDFETPRPQPPVTVRYLYDPIWQIISDEEIAARGDGWDADFSLLKNMFENASEAASEDRLPLNRSRNFRALSDSSTTTLCDAIEKSCSLNQEYFASSASSSPMMDAICKSMQTNSATDKAFYAARSRPHSAAKQLDPWANLNGLQYNCLNSSQFKAQNVKKKLNGSSPDDGLEHISQFLPVTTLRDLASNDLKSKPQSEFAATISDVIADIPPASPSQPISQPTEHGNPWIESTKKCKHRKVASVDRNTGFPAQPLVQCSSSPIVTEGSGNTTLNNAAYNNFTTWQWPPQQSLSAFHEQPTSPQIAQLIPLVPHLSATNSFFTRPNVLATTTPFYNNIIQYRLLQQQILLQKQQLAAAELFMQHQQQQQRQQRQRQRQHQTNQMRQHHYRNSCYERPTRFSHNKYKNINQKQKQKQNNEFK